MAKLSQTNTNPNYAFREVAQSILVVEDDILVNELMADVVRTLGYQPLTAYDADSALSILDAARHELVCIILDFEIPGMHAANIIRYVRERRKDLRLILSSGHEQDTIEAQVPMSEISCFIPKPFHLKRLEQDISNVLNTGGESKARE